MPDFVIKAEEYGVPQARHGVILLGIRNDTALKTVDLLHARSPSLGAFCDLLASSAA